MRRKAQAGTAAIWGGGVILVGFGSVLFLEAWKQKVLGFSELSLLEAIIAVILLIFGVISFYLAHK